MFGIFGIHEADKHLNFSGLFATFLIFITFYNQGRAAIVVYEGNTKLEEFADNELVYTQTIRRNGIEGLLAVSSPLHACVNISKPPDMNISLNWFVLISGNSCNFETKVFNAKLAGYSVAIIYTYKGRVESSNNQHGHYRFISDIPAVIIKTEDGVKLKENYVYTVSALFRIVIFPNNIFNIMTFLLLFSIVAGLFLVIMLAFTIIRFFQQSCRVPNGRLSSQHLRQLDTAAFKKGDRYETCAICLEDYKDKDKLRILPCSHTYHTKCIDPWLTNNRRICPVCKRKVTVAGESSNTVGSNHEATETTPLLQGDNPGSYSYILPSFVNPEISTATYPIPRYTQSS